MMRPASQNSQPPLLLSNETAETDLRSDGGAGVVYWLLIMLSVMTLAPCLVLPAWRDYQQAERSRRATVAERTRGAETIARLQRQQRALAVDAVAVSRMARRELAYEEPGEEVVLRAPVDLLERLQDERVALPRVLPDTSNVAPVTPPIAVARVVRLLPNFNYDAIFCTSPNRDMLIALSGGLFIAAIVIFWPATRDDTRSLRPTHAAAPPAE